MHLPIVANAFYAVAGIPPLRSVLYAKTHQAYVLIISLLLILNRSKISQQKNNHNNNG
jgi:hypothetical protein